MLKGTCLSVIVLLMFCSFALGELVDNGDNTVTDTTTGLMWMKTDQVLKNHQPMSWDDGLIYVFELNRATSNKEFRAERSDLALISDNCGNHPNWRIPNRNELQSLINYHLVNPVSDPVFGDASVASRYYWTSSYFVADATKAWVINFHNGQSMEFNKNSVDVYIRPVRGTNAKETK